MPYADVGPIKVPNGLTDEQVLFLSDIFATGYMAADFCNIQPEDTIAVWGCGPVGQFAIKSAFLLGAARVIAIDTVPERLALAAASGAITLDFMKEDVFDRIKDLTHGRSERAKRSGSRRCCATTGWPRAGGSSPTSIQRVPEVHGGSAHDVNKKRRQPTNSASSRL